MKTVNELSLMLDEPINTLTFFAKHSYLFYKEFEIPKKRGVRVIHTYMCNSEQKQVDVNELNKLLDTMSKDKRVQGSWHLRQIHNKINDRIFKKLEYPESVHGFLPNRSTITAVKPHVGKRWLISFDIKDFFESTTSKHIRNSLEYYYGFSNSVAWLLSKLVTRKNRLPQGAVTSPMASNVAFAPIDVTIGDFCNEYGITYTRYADDLMFSFNGDLKSVVLEEIPKLLNEYKINNKKTKVYGPNDIHYALGYVVNTKVNVNKTARRNLEAAIYNFVYKKLIPAEQLSNPVQYKRSLLGKANYMLKANPDLGRLRRRTEELRQFDPNKTEFKELKIEEVGK